MLHTKASTDSWQQLFLIDTKVDLAFNWKKCGKSEHNILHSTTTLPFFGKTQPPSNHEVQEEYLLDQNWCSLAQKLVSSIGLYLRTHNIFLNLTVSRVYFLFTWFWFWFLDKNTTFFHRLLHIYFQYNFIICWWWFFFNFVIWLIYDLIIWG